MSLPAVGVVSGKDKQRIAKTVQGSSRDARGSVFVFALLLALGITLLLLVVLLLQV